VSWGDVHDDDAQPRHGAHLHGVGSVECGRSKRARPQADDDRVGRLCDAGNEQPEQKDEEEQNAPAVGSMRHGMSVAGGRVTAQARRVPDV
jgi:hypothetical protein